MRKSQLGRRSATLRGRRVPVADHVVRFVVDQIQVEGDNLTDGAAITFEVLLLPLAKMCCLINSQVLPLIFCGIVHVVAKLVAKEWRQFATPEFSPVVCKLDWTAEVSEHVAWAGRL